MSNENIRKLFNEECKDTLFYKNENIISKASILFKTKITKKNLNNEMINFLLNKITNIYSHIFKNDTKNNYIYIKRLRNIIARLKLILTKKKIIIKNNIDKKYYKNKLEFKNIKKLRSYKKFFNKQIKQNTIYINFLDELINKIENNKNNTICDLLKKYH